MSKSSFLVEETGELVFCEIEAVTISEGSPLIAGNFQSTNGSWTGIFESNDGGLYAIHDGYIKEMIS